MYEGILGKPCLISIEGILLILAVEGYKALVVHSVLSALCTGICSEVEHVPYMSCPDERPAEQLLDQLFMIVSLILFRVVTLHRIRGMPVQCLTAVLTHTNRTVRIFLVELIKEFAVHIGCSAVPAIVMVIRKNIRNLNIGRIHAAHGNNGHGGQSGGIQAMAQIVQNAMVLQKILILCIAAHGDLVGKSPYDDAGMVVILCDQLSHLRNGILTAVRHVLGDIRNLSPDHQALLVAQIIEMLIVLIVCKANGVGTHLKDQCDILLMILRGQCISLLRTILMAGNTMKRIALTVQNKALLRIDYIAAAAESCDSLIQCLAVSLERYNSGVQMRILASIPKMYILNGEALRCLVSRYLCRCNHLIAVLDDILQNIIVFCIRNKNLNLNLCILALYLRGNHDSRSAIVVEVKMRLRNSDYVHASVQAAVEGKVSHLRIYAVISSVVYCNHDLVL